MMIDFNLAAIKFSVFCRKKITYQEKMLVKLNHVLVTRSSFGLQNFLKKSLS